MKEDGENVTLEKEANIPASYGGGSMKFGGTPKE